VCFVQDQVRTVGNVHTSTGLGWSQPQWLLTALLVTTTSTTFSHKKVRTATNSQAAAQASIIKGRTTSQAQHSLLRPRTAPSAKRRSVITGTPQKRGWGWSTTARGVFLSRKEVVGCTTLALLSNYAPPSRRLSPLRTWTPLHLKQLRP